MSNAAELYKTARRYLAEGKLHKAASLYDTAFGIAPADTQISTERAELLDRLAVVEHGLTFRYIPGGTFLMGSNTGEADEQPVHEVELSHYWLSDTPISWAAYCDLMGWQPPRTGMPQEEEIEAIRLENKRRTGKDRSYAIFTLYEDNKIRMQYCEDRTQRAEDWHTHHPDQIWYSKGQPVKSQELFGTPYRDDPNRPWSYDQKPMVSVAWQEAEELTGVLTAIPQAQAAKVRYRLPTEAQWEKAARGGLVGQLYAWGSAPPDTTRCDFEHFKEFSILPSRTFPPNGYGLYVMCGGVWEWTADCYDALYYAESPRRNPRRAIRATNPEEVKRVVRGGSWSDCAEVVTVSFRMGLSSTYWRDADLGRRGGWGRHRNPNIGFRLCRMEVKP